MCNRVWPPLVRELWGKEGGGHSALLPAYDTLPTAHRNTAAAPPAEKMKEKENCHCSAHTHTKSSKTKHKQMPDQSFNYACKQIFSIVTVYKGEELIDPLVKA